MPALIKMLLYSLYQYQKAESNKGDMIPLDIMIDELHDEDVKKDTIIQTIMNDGRHFRIGLAAGTHSYKKEKNLREIMGNTNIRIFLKPDGNGIDALAKWLNDPSIDRDLLYRMQAGRDCIVDTSLYNKESKDHEHIVLFGEFCSWFNLQKSNNDDESLSDK